MPIAAIPKYLGEQDFSTVSESITFDTLATLPPAWEMNTYWNWKMGFPSFGQTIRATCPEAATLIRNTLKALPWSKKQKKQGIAGELAKLQEGT